jgi:hypothetical protein
MPLHTENDLKRKKKRKQSNIVHEDLGSKWNKLVVLHFVFRWYEMDYAIKYRYRYLLWPKSNKNSNWIFQSNRVWAMVRNSRLSIEKWIDFLSQLFKTVKNHSQTHSISLRYQVWGIRQAGLMQFKKN